MCFQLTHFPCDDWENIYTLSYYHNRIGSMNYCPLFRVRSWNNGVRCMSFCILTNSLYSVPWMSISLTHLSKSLAAPCICTNILCWFIDIKIIMTSQWPTYPLPPKTYIDFFFTIHGLPPPNPVFRWSFLNHFILLKIWGFQHGFTMPCGTRGIREQFGMSDHEESLVILFDLNNAPSGF